MIAAESSTLQPADLFLGIALAVFILYVIHKLLREKNQTFPRLSEAVEKSIRGYPQRYKTEYEGSIYWNCIGKRFTFGIALYRKTWRSQAFVSIHAPVQRSFEMRWPAKRMRISGARDAYEKRLIEESEFKAISDRLRYFDSIRVREDVVSAVRTYGWNADVGDWSDALGGLITFVRYLLDFEQRKDLKVAGEARCPYCRGAVAGQENIVSCRECQTVHHRECWDETNRCSIFGCRGKAELILNGARASRPHTS